MDELMLWWEGANPWLRSVVAVVAVFLLGWVVRRVLLTRLQRIAAATDNDLDDRLVQFFRSFWWFLLVFVAVIWVLRIHGIGISPLLAGAGIAGIAVGLAAKELLADILSGIFLIADRPFRVGDRVKIERIGSQWGSWGDVVDVGVRRTKVRNTDGVVVNYPNSVLANSVVTNFSAEDEPVRVRVRFVVDQDADPARAMEVAAASIAAVEGVLPDTTQVILRSVWDDTRGHLLAGLLMEGRYRIADVRHRTRIRSAVLTALLSDLRRAGIPLAAPRLRLESPAAG